MRSISARVSADEGSSFRAVDSASNARAWSVRDSLLMRAILRRSCTFRPTSSSLSARISSAPMSLAHSPRSS